MKREKRLSFAESVQWVGEWDALSVVDLVQRNKTGQASCRERFCRRDEVSSLAAKREKRLSFVESVQWVGEWDALSVVDLVQRNKTGQASCRGAFVAVMRYRPLL